MGSAATKPSGVQLGTLGDRVHELLFGSHCNSNDLRVIRREPAEHLAVGGIVAGGKHFFNIE